MTIVMMAAIVAAGLFAGGSLYVSLAEHPARIECGGAVGIRHFGPSARRAAVMQGGLAVAGLVLAVIAWLQGAGTAWLIGGLLLGAMIPFTLIVVMRTVRRLLDASLDTASGEALELLRGFGRLHAVRTIVGVVVFALFVVIALRS